MNLDELRQAMASDATVENKNLKTEVEDLKKKLKKERKDHAHDVESLTDDCRALANRCFALTKGNMCIFCELNSYRCSFAIPFDNKVHIMKKWKEKIEKTEVMEDNDA